MNMDKSTVNNNSNSEFKNRSQGQGQNSYSLPGWPPESRREVSGQIHNDYVVRPWGHSTELHNCLKNSNLWYADFKQVFITCVKSEVNIIELTIISLSIHHDHQGNNNTTIQLWDYCVALMGVYENILWPVKFSMIHVLVDVANVIILISNATKPSTTPV